MKFVVCFTLLPSTVLADSSNQFLTIHKYETPTLFNVCIIVYPITSTLLVLSGSSILFKLKRADRTVLHDYFYYTDIIHPDTVP